VCSLFIHLFTVIDPVMNLLFDESFIFQKLNL